MSSARLLFILSILIIPLSLFSQVSSINSLKPLKPTRYLEMKSPRVSSSAEFSLNRNLLYPSHHLTFPKGFADTLSLRMIEIDYLQNQPVSPTWFKGAIVPAGLFIAGTITLLPENYMVSKYNIQEQMLRPFPGFDTHVDNYLQYVPLAAVFGLKAAGVKSRSDFVNQMVITAKAELLMGVIVTGMKTWIRIERPERGGVNTMPSGHTAQAFLTATILNMEYRDTSPWIGVGGYAVATATAIGRMVNNEHWISDVLIGAGIGIFSTKIVYYTHRYRWGKKMNFVVLPAIYKKGGGMTFAMQL